MLLAWLLLAELLLLLAGLLLVLAGLLSLMLEWQLLLDWLMLVQLLLLLMAELLSLLLAGLLSLLLGLRPLPVWMLVLLLGPLLLLCFSFCHPGLPPAILPFLPLSVSGAFAVLHAHMRRIRTGEVDAHFKNQFDPGALLILCQEARGSPTKARKRQGGMCAYPC
jgi:hypothetical protein